ncbi:MULTISPECIES: hypothetical protein [Burkholderia]|uniref:Uncharacterized protein n=1 Tax=Burkholderia diffusa TaxID=488732 RepID=A0A6P2L739_9BURK|nr:MULTISPECIES: hypothetical protein [Burkholderia]KAB0648099.1 hypothetical protein F7R23_31505 [Burkholderia diffusa]MBM2651711.1 hypothetical protein [Burkholderia diffusa]RQZ63324.1 hypothetical protein DIE08_26285 [Burkholderia sp. Bp9004]VWB64988.1 hypothetical protein BDI24065_03051 [Burkholderia diffusa]
MKHIDGIRFVATGLALRHVGRVRAPRTHARVAPVARVATALCGVARRSLSLRLVMQLAAAPVANATAIAFRRAPAFALRRIAHARAAPAMPSPARRRPFSSVRLTLMQDHSS